MPQGGTGVTDTEAEREVILEYLNLVDPNAAPTPWI